MYVLLQHTSATQTSHDLNKCNRAPSEALVISELTRPFIQVRITCLQSDVQEKSLPVDMHTTAHEVVCMLVNANNVISSKNTADVEQFCLVEVKSTKLLLLVKHACPADCLLMKHDTLCQAIHSTVLIMN